MAFKKYLDHGKTKGKMSSQNIKYWITNLTNPDGIPSFFLFHALSLTITTVSVLKEEMKIHYY